MFSKMCKSKSGAYVSKIFLVAHGLYKITLVQPKYLVAEAANATTFGDSFGPPMHFSLQHEL